MRKRIAGVVAVASLLLGLVVAPIAGAVPAPPTSNGSTTPTVIPPMMTQKVVGGPTSGPKAQFKGTYAIQRFVHRGKHVYAVGTLKGTFKGHHITRYGVKMPASLTSGSSAAKGASTAQATSCSVLHLVLGPINLNLLGLVVTVGGGTIAPGTPATEPITVNIDAVPSGGLLGNLLGSLLCNNPLLSGLSGLSGGQLSGLLNGVAGILQGLGL